MNKFYDVEVEKMNKEEEENVGLMAFKARGSNEKLKDMVAK